MTASVAKEVETIYLDLSEVFDTVSYKILIEGRADSGVDWKPAARPGPEHGDQWHKVWLEAGN